MTVVSITDKWLPTDLLLTNYHSGVQRLVVKVVDGVLMLKCVAYAAIIPTIGGEGDG